MRLKPDICMPARRCETCNASAEVLLVSDEEAESRLDSINLATLCVPCLVRIRRVGDALGFGENSKLHWSLLRLPGVGGACPEGSLSIRDWRAA